MGKILKTEIVSKILVMALFVLCLCSVSYALPSSDGFESGTFCGGSDWNSSCWIYSGSTAILGWTFPYEGNRHVWMRSNTGVMYRNVSVTGYSNIMVSFASKVVSFESNDKAFFSVRLSNGTLITIKEWNLSQSDTGWIMYNFNLSSYGITTGIITLNFTSQGNDLGDEIHFDLINVTGTVGVAQNISLSMLSNYAVGTKNALITFSSSEVNTLHTVELYNSSGGVFCNKSLLSPSVANTAFSVTCDMTNNSQTDARAFFYISNQKTVNATKYFNILSLSSDASKLDIQQVYFSPQVLQGGSTEIFAIITGNVSTAYVTLTFPNNLTRVLSMTPTTNIGEYRAFITDTFQTGNVSFYIRVESGSYFDDYTNKYLVAPYNLDFVNIVNEVGSVLNIMTQVPDAKVMGTDYTPGDNGKVFLQLVDGNSSVNNAGCFLDLYYPNNTVMTRSSLMNYMSGSDGLYYYDLTIPQTIGVYMVSAKCFYNYNAINSTAYNYSSGQWVSGTINYTYLYDGFNQIFIGQNIGTTNISRINLSVIYTFSNFTWDSSFGYFAIDIEGNFTSENPSQKMNISIYNYNTSTWDLEEFFFQGYNDIDNITMLNITNMSEVTKYVSNASGVPVMQIKFNLFNETGAYLITSSSSSYQDGGAYSNDHDHDFYKNDWGLNLTYTGAFYNSSSLKNLSFCARIEKTVANPTQPLYVRINNLQTNITVNGSRLASINTWYDICVDISQYIYLFSNSTTATNIIGYTYWGNNTNWHMTADAYYPYKTEYTTVSSMGTWTYHAACQWVMWLNATTSVSNSTYNSNVSVYSQKDNLSINSINLFTYQAVTLPIQSIRGAGELNVRNPLATINDTINQINSTVNNINSTANIINNYLNSSYSLSLDADSTCLGGNVTLSATLLKSGDGALTGKNVTMSVYYPNGTIYISNLSTIEITSGVYNTNVTIPTSPDGTYIFVATYNNTNVIKILNIGCCDRIYNFLSAMNSTVTNVDTKINGLNVSLNNLNSFISSMNLSLMNELYAINGSIFNISNSLYWMNGTLYNVNNNIITLNNSMYAINGTILAMNRTLIAMNGTLYDLSRNLTNVSNSLWWINGTVYNVNMTVNSINLTTNSMNNTLNNINTTLTTYLPLMNTTLYGMNNTLYYINGTNFMMNNTVNAINGTINIINGSVFKINYTLYNLNATLMSYNNFGNITLRQLLEGLTEAEKLLIQQGQFNDEEIYLITDAVTAIQSTQNAVASGNLTYEAGVKQVKEIKTQLFSNRMFDTPNEIYVEQVKNYCMAYITNEGKVPGEYEVTMSIDGQKNEAHNIKLKPFETISLGLSLDGLQKGKYECNVLSRYASGQSSGKVMVVYDPNADYGKSIAEKTDSSVITAIVLVVFILFMFTLIGFNELKNKKNKKNIGRETK